MNKIKLEKINMNIYEEKLENNLTVLICKIPGYEKKICYFETLYGSVNNEFVPINGNKMIKYPKGIAHFLEHKLFESEENEDTFALFQNDGAYLNAATSYEKTYYYFTCTNNFESNLIRLIDMVQTPYFTDLNVEKEKGIIGQEIDMYKSDLESVLYQTLCKNLFVNYPVKDLITGEKEDIEKITKENLYDCYNTFYNPSNMFIVIVGDVDKKKTINIIKENQAKKEFIKINKIKQKEIIEPLNVNKKYEELKDNVVSKKTGYGYKIILDKKDNITKIKEYIYIKIFLRSRFGELSSFEENLIKQKIVKSYIYNYVDKVDNYLFISFFADELNDNLEKIIYDNLNNKEDLKESFEIYKKAIISNYIRIFENPNEIASHIKGMYENYKTIIPNLYDIYNEINYDEYYDFISKLNFDNNCKVVINKKEK